jgi:hypothetical protein
MKRILIVEDEEHLTTLKTAINRLMRIKGALCNRFDEPALQSFRGGRKFHRAYFCW